LRNPDGSALREFSLTRVMTHSCRNCVRRCGSIVATVPSQSIAMPANGMNPLLKSAVAGVTALAAAVAGTQGLCAQDGPGHAAPPQLTADRGSLRIEGDAMALRLVAQRTTIARALSALASFNVRYRASIGLDEALDGTYAGSLGDVVGRMLIGYNYAARRDGSRLEVTIFGKGDEFADPAPLNRPTQRRPPG
jgi:hypothetical protein